MKKAVNVYDALPDETRDELVSAILSGENIRIERIVSTGQISPEGFWYDQEEDEWTLLIMGEAELRFKDKIIKMVAGDSVFIPAHTLHRVEKTSIEPPCIWICVFGSFGVH